MNKDQLQKFVDGPLSQLVGATEDRNRSFWQKQTKTSFWFHGMPTGASLYTLNPHHDTYWQINPCRDIPKRPDTEPAYTRPREDEISHLVAFYCDFDGKSTDVDNYERVTGMSNQPSLIVWTSENSYHCYWFLERPIEFYGQADRDLWKNYLKDFAKMLGADEAAANLNQQYRLPGYPNLNHPDDEGGYPVVSITSYDESAVYPASLFCEAVDKWRAGQLRREREAQAAKIRDQAPSFGRYFDSALDGACLEIAKAPNGQRNNILNEQAFQIGTLLGAGMGDYAVAFSQLVNAGRLSGLNEKECETTVKSGLTDGQNQPRDVSHLFDPPTHKRQSMYKTHFEQPEPLSDNDLDDLGTDIFDELEILIRKLKGEMPMGVGVIPCLIPNIKNMGGYATWWERPMQVIIGGATGTGKSSLLDDILHNALAVLPHFLNKPVSVAKWSPETPASKTAERTLIKFAYHDGVNSTTLADHKAYRMIQENGGRIDPRHTIMPSALGDVRLSGVDNAHAKIKHLLGKGGHFYQPKNHNIPVDKVFEWFSYLVWKTRQEGSDLPILAIDYMQLVKNDKGQTDWVYWEKVATDFKALCSELNCVGIILSQPKKGDDYASRTGNDLNISSLQGVSFQQAQLGVVIGQRYENVNGHPTPTGQGFIRVVKNNDGMAFDSDDFEMHLERKSLYGTVMGL